jgi:hypothetical protein
MGGIPRAHPTLSAVLFGGQVLVGLVAIATMFWGITELLQSLWSLITTGRFTVEPFWRTLGLAEAPNKALRWDRAWWLLLIGPAAMFALSSGMGELSTDLRKSAREQARERRIKRQHDTAFAKLEAKSRQQRQRRAGRSPMSGWKRLWIVLSLLAGVPIFLIQYNEDTNTTVYHTPSRSIAALKDQAFWNALYWEAHAKQPSLKGCILPTVEMKKESYGLGYSIECERTFVSAANPAIFYAAFPALFMWLVGWTLHWVYRGFRPNRLQRD